MAEENGGAPQIKMSVLAQFVRDMSFENMVAQKGLTTSEVQPDIQVQVSLDARKRPQDHQFDIVTKFKVTSKNKVNGDTLFLLEVDYGGIFHVEGVPEEQLHPFLMIECPRLLFPVRAADYLGCDARRWLPAVEHRHGGFYGTVSAGNCTAGAACAGGELRFRAVEFEGPTLRGRPFAFQI